MRFGVRVVTLFAVGMLSVASFAASGQELLTAGRLDEAIATLQSHVASHPEDAEAQHLLCRAYYNIENWDRAIAACEKATALAPGNASYHLWLGRAYGQKAAQSHMMAAASLARKVKAEFERAVQLDPQNGPARIDLSEFYLQAPALMGGGTDKALAQVQALTNIDPAAGRVLVARIAEKNKNYSAAEKELRAAAAASNSADTWNQLAQFYQRQGRLDEVEKAIQHVPQATVQQQASLVESAETLLNAGRNFAGAIALLRQYLAKLPAEEAPRAHYLLGLLFEKQGDKDAAAQEYRTSLSIARSFASAQSALSHLSH
ncbi:MAG: tetratricopeptide repeat protein [Acidobacteriales bacterium]|nr:tetratricopeptide repeat protein [Terriglobales bacterium]